MARVRPAATRWALALKEAREDLVAFCRFMMPSPEDYENPDLSLYAVRPHHRYLADKLMDAALGDNKRLAVSIMPQSGKTHLLIMAVAWYAGHNPDHHIVFATYNSDLALTRGASVRDQMLSKRYQQVFPGCGIDLARGGSRSHMGLIGGGTVSFVGRGGGSSGRPAHLFVIDDPIKDDAEAQSEAALAECKNWFTKVVMARARAITRIWIVHTRWVIGDLIGMLCDPQHPEHDPEIAKLWTYVCVPAEMQPQHATLAAEMGMKVGDVLWPEVFPRELLREKERIDPEGYRSLYMGQPAREGGSYFKENDICEYASLGELPPGLLYYGASDHATGLKSHNDASCIGVAGMDDKRRLWIMPEIEWARIETDVAVRRMIALMQRFRTTYWFLEGENISRSFGPFLRAQMQASRVSVPLVDINVTSDKRQVGRSAQGMVQTGQVFFPKFAPWWPQAKKQMLQFPKVSGFDDFVSFLSILCLGLDMQYGAGMRAPVAQPVQMGTFRWLHAQWDRDDRQKSWRM